jgi:hypothetical protein
VTSSGYAGGSRLSFEQLSPRVVLASHIGSLPTMVVVKRDGPHPVVDMVPTLPGSTNVVLAGRATTVPFTAVLPGPQWTVTDSATEARPAKFDDFAGNGPVRTGFASRGSWVRVPSSPPT